MTQEIKQQEYKNRYDMVLGIFVASVFGFIINLASNIVYDVWVIEEKSFSSISPFAFSFIFYGFILTEAFLEFLVYDYQNETNFDIFRLRAFMFRKENRLVF